MITKTLIAMLALSLTHATPASAQVHPSAATHTLVQTVTEAFFDQLPKNDFNAERAFMADHFAVTMTPKKWQSGRELLLEKIGSTPRYTAHNLTYYQQEHLLAAVDFSAKSDQPDTYVCGYILWEMPMETVIGFTRLEHNIVSEKLVKKMDLKKAVQLLTNWHCPNTMIETVLGVTLQK